jgi:hypothetical protein
MKKLISIFMVVALCALCACEPVPLAEVFNIEIERYERGINSNLNFFAKKAEFNYAEREITLSGVDNIGGMGTVVSNGNIRLDGGNLIISLPADSLYKINIFGQTHYVAAIKKK